MNVYVKHILMMLFLLITTAYSNQSYAGHLSSSLQFEVSDEDQIELISYIPGDGLHYGVFFDGSLAEFENQIADGMHEFGEYSAYSFQNLGFLFTQLFASSSEEIQNTLYSDLLDVTNEIAETVGEQLFGFDFIAAGFETVPLVSGCSDIKNCSIVIPFQSRDFIYTHAFVSTYSESNENQVQIIELTSDFTTKDNPNMTMMILSEGFIPVNPRVSEPSTIGILLLALILFVRRNKCL